MDAEERKVLRRKRQTIVIFLKLGEKQYEFLTSNKYMERSTVEAIKTESTNAARVAKLIDVLPTSCRRKPFSVLCDMLEIESPWLSEEMRADLRLEKGEMAVEPYVEKEAGLWVYKDFGNSKRLSEMEKKDIQLLVARRTQCTKETWRGLLLKTEEKLRKTTKHNQECEESALELVDIIRSFIRMNKKRLRKDVGGKKLATSGANMEAALEPENSGRPVMEILDELVDDLRGMAGECLQEMDSVYEERRKAFGIMNVEEMSGSLKLDKELEAVLGEAELRIQSSQQEANESDLKAKSLEEQLKMTTMKLQRELEQREVSIKTLRAHLDRSHATVRDLNESLDYVQEELANTRDELAKYKNKSELLEKNRRLGYKHDRILPEKSTLSNGEEKHRPSAGRSATASNGTDKAAAAGGERKLGKSPGRKTKTSPRN